MFRKLHLQLTALCITITGLILAVLSVICLFISESGICNQENSSFLASLNTIYQNLEEQTTLSHSWLRQTEYNYQISIQIWDAGIPLLFQSLDGNAPSEALWNAVSEKALSDYGIDLQVSGAARPAEHQEFAIKDAQGHAYTASAAVLSRSGGVIGVMILHPLAARNQLIFRQRFAFILADLAALALLAVFYWFFTAHMLRPLEENKKKQIQFVASASHELRSPLTVILSNVAAVKNHVMSPDDQFLNTIYSEGNRMSRLISDMLQLASADNRTWSMHPSKIEPDTLLLQVWEDFEPMAMARGLHWDISLPDETVPHCVCDAERIRQLLGILIDNAFCYTPRGGHIRLSLSESAPFPSTTEAGNGSNAVACGRFLFCSKFSRSGDSGNNLYISVADDGPGIPDDQKNTVFERFSRLDASRGSKMHFGLGLCIAQEIARLHKGRLLLTDTPGGGATFTFILPPAPILPPEQAEDSPPSPLS